MFCLTLRFYIEYKILIEAIILRENLNRIFMYSPFSSSPIDDLSFAFEQLSIQPAQDYCGCFNQSPTVLGQIIQRPTTPFYDGSNNSPSYNFSYQNENAGISNSYPFIFGNEYFDSQ